MTDLIYDYITTGVDMVISGAILSSIVMILYTSSRLSVELNNSQATAETLAYYMQFNQFDNKNVLASDVIGTIIKYSSELEVVVYDSDGSTVIMRTMVGDPNIYLGGGTSNTIPKNARELTNYIMGDTKYHAKLVNVGDTGGVGTVMGILFYKQ